ncbi:MAG: heme ABC transporter permease [Pseudomonadota bacterium]
MATVFDTFANPARFEALSKRLAPFCLISALLLIVIATPLALAFSPADYQQGDAVRIKYVHVPAAWLATLAFTFMAAMSAIAFVWRHPIADEAAKSAAPVGLAMTGLTLFTGAIWGKPMWGAWWVWDVRLTSALVLFFIYLGYLAVWDAVEDRTKAAKYARLVALTGFINVPIVKFSVDWWNSLHQPASIIRMDGPTIHSSMLTPLLMMILAYSLFFGWFVLTGVEASILETRAQRRVAPTPTPSTMTEAPRQPLADAASDTARANG